MTPHILRRGTWSGTSAAETILRLSKPDRSARRGPCFRVSWRGEDARSWRRTAAWRPYTNAALVLSSSRQHRANIVDNMLSFSSDYSSCSRHGMRPMTLTMIALAFVAVSRLANRHVPELACAVQLVSIGRISHFLLQRAVPWPLCTWQGRVEVDLFPRVI